MGAIISAAERLSEHAAIKFVEKWIDPFIARHWIVSLALTALVLFPTVIGWYRRRRTL